MAKAKQLGKRTAASGPKGTGKPTRLVASVTSRTPSATAAAPAGARGVGGAMPKAIALTEVTAGVELWDVVCDVDSVLVSSVPFGTAQSTARKHNRANPGHDAQPIRQQ